jgi:putative transposase
MSTIHKAMKIRIYPTKDQETLILKTIGSCRFLYNAMLSERIETYQKLKDDRKTLYEHKHKTEKQYKEEFPWMKEVDSVALQFSRIDLSAAYMNFFNSLKGKRKGEAVGFPKFHKKGSKDSYRTCVTNGNVRVDFVDRTVRLPKVGFVKFRDLRPSMEGTLKQVTVSRTPTGKYFASMLFEQELTLNDIELKKGLKTKGLDMSLSKFFVDDEGNSPAYEKLYRDGERKLARLQRRASRRKKGSKNRAKAYLALAREHESIANKRRDFTQKLSTELVRENDVIVIESLSLKDMSRALRLGKSVMDLGYSEFVRQLRYKALWNEVVLVEADKWFASSKTCSKCGHVHKGLQLSDRVFECPCCGHSIDRDENAGKNLRAYGLQELGLT